MKFFAEGVLNYPQKFTYESLLAAMHSGAVLESTALSYDSSGRLHFQLGEYAGIMPHDACADANGGAVRDIALMTRVGHSVCFVITGFCSDTTKPYFLLSRAKAQQQCKEQYLDTLLCGDVLSCRVTHIEPFGAFCDVGCGISALLPIDCLSVSRIASPANRLAVGQDIWCLVKGRDEYGRLVLTMKELYGTWEENAAKFSIGETVVGIVRSKEPYGVFVELTPNLAGLAEADTSTKPGEAVSIYIKNILPQKMKLKLVILRTLPDFQPQLILPPKPTFTHLDQWIYSPPGANRIIETNFI